jgi:hypothetical protein
MAKLISGMFVFVIFYLMHTFAGYVPADYRIVFYGLAIIASLNLVTKA